jgi:hypothetical protein
VTPTLTELLFKIRQDPAFRELLEAVGAPELTKFSPTKGNPDIQFADFIFRSGARRQHESWLVLLIGEPTSDREKT